MCKLIFLSEFYRMFKRSRYVRKNGFKQYSGNSIEKCKQILNDCYNKEKGFFQVSNGHFTLFYIRDFGWIVNSLMKLGYKNKVRSTLNYALNIYSKNHCVTTSISMNDEPFDFPYMSVDSLPYLIYSLSCLNDKQLVKKYKSFLENEIIKFYDLVIDKNTGLVRQDKFFSSMKDYSKRKSSCYDNSMLYLLKVSCDKLGLKHLFAKWDYRELLVQNFWNGNYFYDDIVKKDYVAGDANVFPFWVGAIKNKNMLRKVIQSLKLAKLDYPFPLKYTFKKKHSKFIGFEFIANNYEGNTIWMHMGPLYVMIVGKVDKKLQQKYIIKYSKIIEKYSTFLEVFNPDSKPYQLPYYISDEAMSWCANYLFLMSIKNEARK
ncbi:MAG: hypothetical protein ACMXYG_00930 [Candidatus Woesearchaeota archaeon]